MTFTLSDVQQLTIEATFKRGQEYFSSGLVRNLQRRGTFLLADVYGSDVDSYYVKIALSNEGIDSVNCNCFYQQEGICKHVVATLLTYLENPESAMVRRSVEELLLNTSENNLRSILNEWLTDDLALADKLEAKLATLSSTRSEADSSLVIPRRNLAVQPPVDVIPFERRAHYILNRRGARHYYDYAEQIIEDFTDLYSQVKGLINQGDGRNALKVLETITQPLLDCWYEYGGEGEVCEVFYYSSPLFTEAVLCSNLKNKEREEWQRKLKNWHYELSRYGVDDVFLSALAALEQGWDTPDIKALLRGTTISDNSSVWDNDELIDARLNILARQGRTQEFINLAKTTDSIPRLTEMLINLNRAEEAIEYAYNNAIQVRDIENLVLQLNDLGKIYDAIKLAEFGLTLKGNPYSLAVWLRDKAIALENRELAKLAANTALSSSWLLEDYKVMESVSGPEWNHLKPGLLKAMSEQSFPDEKIEIYLYENMYEEAINEINKGHYFGYTTIEKVVDAVYRDYPDWAIKQCKKQAEPDMERGKSKCYHQCVNWVEKAGRTWLASNRKEEWMNYLNSLINKHKSKYSLKPQLENLRALGSASA